MKLRTIVACSLLLVVPAMLSAADPDPADLLGKWELTEEAAGIPKGTIFDFRKDGKLFITAEVKGKKDTIESFRNYVGLHLNTYLKDNDIAVDEDQLTGPQNGESAGEPPAE